MGRTYTTHKVGGGKGGTYLKVPRKAITAKQRAARKRNIAIARRAKRTGGAFPRASYVRKFRGWQGL